MVTIKVIDYLAYSHGTKLGIKSRNNKVALEYLH